MKIRLAALCALMALALIGVAWRLSRADPGPDPGVSSLADRTPGVGLAQVDVATPLPDLQERMAVATAEDAGATALTETMDVPLVEERGSLQVRVVWRDGSPAPGVAILLISPGTRRHRHGDRWDMTDEGGLVTYEDLVPGSYTLEAERGAKVKVKVVSGESASADLMLEGPYDVHGIVRDSAGRPVPGAEVVAVAWRYDWRGSRPVATSDGDGRFVISCIHDGRSLGAFASGWAPSKLFDLSTVDPATVGSDHIVEVELVLGPRGADIWGTVTDPDGAPVEGALVAVGTSHPYQDMFRGGHFKENPKPHVVESDREGRYRIEGVAEGPQPLAAWHRDWAIWSSNVEIAAGTDVRQDIVLSPGVTVFGVVRLADGEPAPEAFVLALPEPFIDSFPKQGPTNDGTPFPNPRTQAGPDGSYELGPIAPGVQHMHASLGTSYLTRWTGSEPEYKGTLQESLTGAAGERVEWNPTLSFGFAISGRAVHADGTPVSDEFVTAIDPGGEHFATTTGEDGTFMIPSLQQVPHRVTFQMPFRAPKTASVEAFYDVVPPADDLLFQLDYTPMPDEPEGKLRVRLDDEAGLGAALGKGAVAPVIHYETEFAWRTMDAGEDGLYETSLPPGHYKVVLSVPSQIVLHAGRIEIRSGETLDLGTLKTQPLGSLEITLERPEGLQGPVQLRPLYYDAPELTIDANKVVGTLNQLAPGQIKIEVSGEGIVKEALETEILAGITSRLRVAPRPASIVSIETSLERSQGFRRLTLTVVDSKGKEWLDRVRRERVIREWPFVTELSLPVGSYTVRVSTSDGQTAERMLDLEAPGAHDPFPIKAR